MLERDLEKKITLYAKGLGLLSYKFTSPAHRSVPDRMFIAPQGNVFFVEFKAPGKKLRPLQAVTIDKMKRMGVRVYMIDDLIEGRGIIFAEHQRSIEKEIDEKHR